MNLLRRYRSYLSSKAASIEPPRTVEMSGHLVPWLMPLFLCMLVQDWLGLEGPFWFYLTFLMFGVVFFGIAVVGWAFLVDGAKEDLRRYRATKEHTPKD